jgi:hypothetical protein
MANVVITHTWKTQNLFRDSRSSWDRFQSATVQLRSEIVDLNGTGELILLQMGKRHPDDPVVFDCLVKKSGYEQWYPCRGTLLSEQQILQLEVINPRSIFRN